MNRNLSYKDKQRVITCKLHNSGLYGTEAAPPSQKELARYRAAVAKVSGPSSYRTSATMQFEVMDAPANLDPVVHMFQRRVCLLRRCIEKCPDNLRLIRDIILLYIKANHTGAYHAGTQLAVLQPAQPPSAKGNKAWTTVGCYGPVGLLLHQVSTCGAALSVNLEIHQHLQVPYSICLVAYNHLPNYAQRTASLARTAAAGKARTLVKGIKEVNHPVLEAALKQQTVDRGRWLRYHMSLGTLTPSALAEHIPEDTGKCRHCPHPKADLVHLLWECPAFAEERYKDDPTLVMLPYKQLPPQLRIGIPPPLQLVAGNTCLPLEEDPLVLDAHPAFCDSVLPPEAHQFISDAAQAWHDGTGNIREVFNSMRGSIPADNTLAINYDGPSLQGTSASNTPDSWTDGSVILPRGIFSLGGAAVWQPDRDVETEQLTANESMIAVTEQFPDKDGIALIAALPGEFCSSTRAEIAGGILSLLRPRATQFGTDSKSFLYWRRCQQLVQTNWAS